MSTPPTPPPERARLLIYTCMSIVLVIAGSSVTLTVVYRQQKQAYHEQLAHREYHLGSALLVTELESFLSELLVVIHDDTSPGATTEEDKLLKLMRVRLGALNKLRAEAVDDAQGRAALARLGESLDRLFDTYDRNPTHAEIDRRIVLAQQRAAQLNRLHTVIRLDDPSLDESLEQWRSLLAGIVAVGLVTLGGVLYLMRLAFRAYAQRQRFERALLKSEAGYKQLALQRRNLLNELDHRVKNNLAGLMSLVNIYEASSGGVDEFAASMSDKLQAMGAAHEMMGQSGQLPIDMRGLILRIADQFGAIDQEERLRLECDRVSVVSRQITPLAIVFQELFSNSAKHGAYSNGVGRVHVSCASHDPNPRDIGVHLVWRESGGPPVTPPDQPGQGLDMVEGFVQYELKGACEYGFEPDGFRFELRCRLSRAVTESEPQSVV
ncbi:MAG: sensor histidine kinase [Planctomycetota bacterium]|jgi:two-component sensor histidine kinase